MAHVNAALRSRSWPALLDLLAATLMVFLLVTFLQRILSADEREALLVRQQQMRFAELAQESLAEEFASGKVRLERRQDALILTFSDRLLFGSGDYRLKPSGRAVLQRCRDLLVGAQEAFDWVQVEGHTDPLPIHSASYPANNWQLSAARAISVVELLTSTSELAGGRFSATGYAWFRPVAANDSPQGRALNRRIEMRIFFSGAPASAAEGPAGASP